MYVLINGERQYYRNKTRLGYVEFTSIKEYAEQFDDRLDAVAMMNFLWDMGIETCVIPIDGGF